MPEPAPPDPPASSEPLSRTQKAWYVSLFFAGLVFTFPALLPASIACASVLLLKPKCRKVNLMGLFVLAVDLIVLAAFTIVYMDSIGGV